MSSPAASAPLAVLVLAWDETTPAARVLVEATEMQEPAIDSVVALVPTGPPTNELSQEEFLPLEASPELFEAPAAPANELPVETAEPEPEEAESEMLAKTDFDTPGPTSLLAATSPAEVPPAPVAPTIPATAATAEALVKPALVWQEVRVLRLSAPSPAALASYSGQVGLSLVWDGTANVPAAPYLGSSELTLANQGSPAAKIPALAASLLAATETAASALVALRTPGVLTINSLLPASEAAAAPAYPLEELPAAPDAELDTTPAPAPSELVPLTGGSTTELSEEAAAPEESFVVDTTPVQAAALATPVAPTPPTTEPLIEPEHFAAGESPQLAALRPAGQPFDAPNLNFQIIQYARLAVPQALAEQPFGVIYAPAWPTWLAAQELRHRSGQPLVLHLAQLAAPDGEPIDLATGWVAELQRQALHRADLILAETPALAQRLRHELALPAHRVRTVPAADAVAVAQALRTAVRV